MTNIENKWGRPGFEQQIHRASTARNLTSVTAALSLSTRQRIYAFIKRGEVFKRGTWNGCVMNAASGPENVMSFQAAAEFFDEPVMTITHFIDQWDATAGTLIEKDANRLLEEVLLQCGVTSESPTYKAPKEHEKVKVFRVRLFTGTETKAVEELRAEIEAGAFDADLASFQELVGV